jgi:imidazolonepropionase-like amidohydrolase
VIRGGTLVDGRGGEPILDAEVVVRDGRIATVGKAGQVSSPAGAEVVDAGGGWILPGLVDAHVHFGQTGWLDGRPDAADLRETFPYPEVAAELERNPDRYYRSYFCSGVTSTFDVGGYPWTRDLQRRGERDPSAVRVSAAGALLSTVDFWLNLPDRRQFVHMAGDSVVRRTVRSHAASGSSAIKVWYIVPGSWSSSDSTRFSDLVHLAGAEADSAGLPLVVHATGLWEAKDAIRAGAEVLVHSVFDEPVDEEFLRLAEGNDVVYTPTLTVTEGYRNAYLGRTAGAMPYPSRCVDERTRELYARGLPPERRPPWAREAGTEPPPNLDLERGLANLERVHETGITVATGTDAGNPGTAHGASIVREMELMARAGMSPMEVIVASTRNAARAMGRGQELGVVEAGRRADLLVVSEDPLADVTNLAAVETVVKGGTVVYRGAEEDEGGS